MGLLVLCIVGCEKGADTVEKAADPSSPKSYMHDKAFLAELDQQKAAQVETMKEYDKAFKAYKKALEADAKGERPETKALRAKVDELEAKYKAQRAETMKIVGRRIAPKKQQSAANQK